MLTIVMPLLACLLETELSTVNITVNKLEGIQFHFYLIIHLIFVIIFFFIMLYHIYYLC